MKFKSQLVTEASGSIGGTTFSRNRGGMYIRARALPINPNTVQQQVIRSAVALLASAWLNILTLVQRTAWDLYALNVPLLDRLGEPRNVGGIAMYVRSNVPRIQAAQSRIEDAPTIFNLGAYSPMELLPPSEAAQDVVLDLITDPPLPDEWLSEDGAFAFIYTARPQNQSINFFKGPYRFAGLVAGNATTPETYPLTAAVQFPFVADQKVFVRVNVSRADGRLGTDQFLGAIAIASAVATDIDTDRSSPLPLAVSPIKRKSRKLK